MDAKEQVRKILRDFKGDNYAFGLGVFDKLGEFASRAGKTAMLVGSMEHYPDLMKQAMSSPEKHGVKMVPGSVVNGARPNAPREDVYRVETCILHHKPDCVVSVGGGSLIDGLKASAKLKYQIVSNDT